MISEIQNFLNGHGAASATPTAAAYIILVAIAVLICAVVILVANKIVLRILTNLLSKSRFPWAGIMLRRRVFHRIVYSFPAAVIYALAGQFPEHESTLQKTAEVFLIAAFLFVVEAVLNSFQDFYGSFDIHKAKPIKGLIQLLKIVTFLLGAIVIIAALTNQSPLILLTGIGAFSAVLLLIFKDSLLGLVAGIQLSADDMVRIGDWITMDKYNADGDVVDITLHTVKVENFDHTITTIPAYAMISDSFINWRNVQNIKARRIKRAINIDMGSIAFCPEEMLLGMREIGLLTDYLPDKRDEIAAHNDSLGLNTGELANGRHLTNLGLFRIFLINYMKNNPKIRQDMPQIVRQLAPTEFGIPLEVYAFTSETEWAAYEGLQADLFDYIISIAPRFGIRIFQSPAGADFKQPR